MHCIEDFSNDKARTRSHLREMSEGGEEAVG